MQDPMAQAVYPAEYYWKWDDPPDIELDLPRAEKALRVLAAELCSSVDLKPGMPFVRVRHLTPLVTALFHDLLDARLFVKDENDKESA